MKRTLFSSIFPLFFLVSLSAMDKAIGRRNGSIEDVLKYCSAPSPEALAERAAAERAARDAQRAQAKFWCVYCKLELSEKYEVDLAEHLAAKHLLCSKCKMQHASLLDVRLCEAGHANPEDVREQ